MLPVRSKGLSELASVPAVHSKSLFEPAVQDHYSKVLVSVALCSESLYSALLCYVHGYARVHTSIYIYIYTHIYIYNIYIYIYIYMVLYIQEYIQEYTPFLGR